MASLSTSFTPQSGLIILWMRYLSLKKEKSIYQISTEGFAFPFQFLFPSFLLSPSLPLYLHPSLNHTLSEQLWHTSHAKFWHRWLHWTPSSTILPSNTLHPPIAENNHTTKKQKKKTKKTRVSLSLKQRSLHPHVCIWESSWRHLFLSLFPNLSHLHTCDPSSGHQLSSAHSPS